PAAQSLRRVSVAGNRKRVGEAGRVGRLHVPEPVAYPPDEAVFRPTREIFSLTRARLGPEPVRLRRFASEARRSARRSNSARAIWPRSGDRIRPPFVEFA